MAVERLRELFISGRNASGAGPPSAPGSYPLIVTAHVGLLTLPALEIVIGGRRVGRATAIGWLGVLAGATALRWWSISTLGPAWNVRGQVTDGFRPVASGPYRYIRHPNYLALLLEFAALPMAGGAWVSAIGLSLLNGAALALRIRAEEAQLERSSEYRRTFHRRARLVPGLI